MHLAFLIQIAHDLWKDTSELLSPKYQTLNCYSISWITYCVKPNYLIWVFCQLSQVYLAALIFVVLSTISSRPSRGVWWLYRSPFSGVQRAPHTTSLNQPGDSHYSYPPWWQRPQSKLLLQTHSVASMYDHCSSNTFSLRVSGRFFCVAFSQACGSHIGFPCLSAGLLFEYSKKHMDSQGLAYWRHSSGSSKAGTSTVTLVWPTVLALLQHRDQTSNFLFLQNKSRAPEQ